eukprot:4431072-Amphidinium_carterae.1
MKLTWEALLVETPWPELGAEAEDCSAPAQPCAILTSAQLVSPSAALLTMRDATPYNSWVGNVASQGNFWVLIH